jgi:phenylalanyl-tRNA synthetase alpha chain
MDIGKLIETLHPLERKVLPVLEKVSKLNEIISETGLSEVEVMRALQWMQNKSIIELKEDLRDIIILEKNGHKYVKEGLPERRFLNSIKDKELKADEIKSKANLDNQEFNVCVGTLKKKLAIDIKKNKDLIISITKQGKKFLEKDSLEEIFLKKDFPVEAKKLSDEERFAFENLKKRKDIVEQELIKERSAQLTNIGKKILKKGISEKNVIDSLTPKIIKEGSWRNKKFRRYDIEINVPPIYPGKRHFVNEAIEYARRIWLDMGFQEMEGSLVQTSFWNFDSLFTAQDHPVRDLQDTYFIENPEKGKLPGKNILNAVKKAHEKGVKGSTGWNYKWNEKEAKKNVLRTHTTVLSAKTIAKIKESELPVKFFSVGKCFRNEAIDWSHLFEFNQTEGIVVDPDANLRHLIGYLKEFFKKMGFPKARFRPAYFPYTEPSLEIDVYHPVHKKWFELGGAGIFRPEVVIPLLGKDIPVLAWGPGFDRIIMDYYKITDIRDLYKNDVKQLREIKAWLR